MSRISYTVKNARVAFVFSFLLLLLNFFSRRVFIDVLGNDLVGLTASIQGYIGMLNLAELGISTAIAAMLYAPLYNADQQKITEIVSIYGYLFRWIGIIICGGGLILACFLPMLFAGDGVEMWAVYTAFFSFLITTLLSYIVNYKQNLLVANQKNYVVITILNTITIVKTIAQIVLLKWFGCDFITWLVMEVVFAVLFAILLEIRVKREYPWLKTALGEGRTLLRKHPEVLRSIKRIFSHKIAAFVTQQSQTIVIQLIMGLSMVTFWGNYNMLVNRINALIVGSLSSNVAGVGHLVAEGDGRKIRLVFWQMNAMFFWIGGVVAFAFYIFVSPLVGLWIPSAEIFSDTIVMLLSVNLFIFIIRQPVNYFVTGYALFADTPAAWTEAILNLSISITMGLKYGILGVAAGTTVSSVLVLMLWRPHYLFTRGFGHRSGSEYWTVSAKFIGILAVVWLGGMVVYERLLIPVGDYTWGRLAVNGLILVPSMAAIYGLTLWFASRGMRDFVKLLVGLVKKLLKFH